MTLNAKAAQFYMIGATFLNTVVMELINCVERNKLPRTPETLAQFLKDCSSEALTAAMALTPDQRAAMATAAGEEYRGYYVMAHTALSVESARRDAQRELVKTLRANPSLDPWLSGFGDLVFLVLDRLATEHRLNPSMWLTDNQHDPAVSELVRGLVMLVRDVPMDLIVVYTKAYPAAMSVTKAVYEWLLEKTPAEVTPDDTIDKLVDWAMQLRPRVTSEDACQRACYALLQNEKFVKDIPAIALLHINDTHAVRTVHSAFANQIRAVWKFSVMIGQFAQTGTRTPEPIVPAATMLKVRHFDLKAYLNDVMALLRKYGITTIIRDGELPITAEISTKGISAMSEFENMVKHLDTYTDDDLNAQCREWFDAKHDFNADNLTRFANSAVSEVRVLEYPEGPERVRAAFLREFLRDEARARSFV